MNIFTRNNPFCILLLVVFTIGGQRVLAQQHHNTALSQYFNNRYLANPAFAGSHTNPYLFGLVNRSWTGFEGAPVLIQFSGDMAFRKSMGAGIQLMSDKAGELQRMQARLSYAYAIPLDKKGQSLRLGFSLSGFKEKLDNITNAAGIVDPLAKGLNEKAWRFDADFGAVYQAKDFFFSAAAYNLNNWINPPADEQRTDQETLGVMTGYTIDLKNKFTVEPLLSARFYTHHSWLYRIGAQGSYDKLVQVSVQWQNNHSIYAGLGLQLKETGSVHFHYGSANEQSYGQLFEVGLGVKLK